MAILVRINPDSTRDDLVTCLSSFNDRAKLISRRGWAAVQSEHYRDLHDTMNALTDAILMHDSIPA